MKTPWVVILLVCANAIPAAERARIAHQLTYLHGALGELDSVYEKLHGSEQVVDWKLFQIPAYDQLTKGSAHQLLKKTCNEIVWSVRGFQPCDYFSMNEDDRTAILGFLYKIIVFLMSLRLEQLTHTVSKEPLVHLVSQQVALLLNKCSLLVNSSETTKNALKKMRNELDESSVDFENKYIDYVDAYPLRAQRPLDHLFKLCDNDSLKIMYHSDVDNATFAWLFAQIIIADRIVQLDGMPCSQISSTLLSSSNNTVSNIIKGLEILKEERLLTRDKDGIYSITHKLFDMCGCVFFDESGLFREQQYTAFEKILRSSNESVNNMLQAFFTAFEGLRSIGMLEKKHKDLMQRLNVEVQKAYASKQ